MKLLRVATAPLLLAVFLFSPHAADASLIGTSLCATITPGTGFTVPTQFTSPATVGPGVEFTGTLHSTNFNEDFNISADFTATDLTVIFTSPNPAANIQSITSNTLVALTFQGFPPTFGGFANFTYACNPSLGTSCIFASNGYYQGSVSGGSITYDFKNLFSGDTYRFYNPPSTSPVPEPSTFAMLGTGLLGAAGAFRRRASLLTRRSASA